MIISVALAMIQATISDRAQFQADAVKSVSAESVREQTIASPDPGRACTPTTTTKSFPPPARAVA
ncbi:inner membrane CreD family protein [Massilia sp. B-10]|nr:inner membrane CreD family protein [Massilia sp. B-10]